MLANAPRSEDEEYVEVVEEGPDPVLTYLRFGIFAVGVLILTTVIYGLFAGVINPPAPRTATEFAYARAQRMIEKAPKNGRNWADYIVLLTAKGNEREAETQLERARKAVTDDTITYVNNAELKLLMTRKQYKQVIERSTEFIKVDSAIRAKQAVKVAKQGIKVPEDMKKDQNAVTIEMLGLRAQAAVALKDYKEALDALTVALRADPYASDVLAFRGDVYVLKGDKQAAEKDYKAALVFISDYKRALDGLKKLGVAPPAVTTTPGVMPQP